MKLLADIGVRAIRVCSVDSSRDVTEGKYQFSTLLLNFFLYENVMLLQSAVFFSPETLQLPAWRKVISSETFKDRLVLVAIDEAHCVSEWLVYSDTLYIV